MTDPYGGVNPWALALMQAGGAALQQARPGGSTQGAFGNALQAFGPTMIAAQRLNQQGALAQQLAKQREAQALLEQQQAQRARVAEEEEARMKSSILSGSYSDPTIKRMQDLGDAEGIRDTLRTRAGQKPSALDLFMSGDPATIAQIERFKKLGVSSPTVNVNTGDTGPQFGTIPPSYMMVQTPEGGWKMQAVPGSPADTEKVEKVEQATAAKEQKERSAGVVVEDIDRALDIARSNEFTATGLGGAAMKAVPGTPAHNLASLLDTVKANIGFDKLQAMRAASPTGGALGQVSERENVLLQSTFGSLQQSQSKEQFEYNLKRLKDLYLDIIHGPGNRPGGKERSEVENMMPDEVKSLLDKYAPQ